MLKKTIVQLLTVISLCGSVLQGQTISTHSQSTLIEQCKAIIAERMVQDSLVGVSAALLLPDGTIWKESFGFADKENGIPMTTATNMCIGSATKPITALGIMHLHENGLLDIDDPLVMHLPQFTIKTRDSALRDITIKSLLTHSSGLPNDILLNSRSKSETYKSMVDYTKDMSVSFPPNTVFHYSNIGMCLLGHTIFEVSGEEYPDYLENHIFNPLGMTNTGFVKYRTLGNLSSTYIAGGIRFDQDPSWRIPAGGLYSNVDDLALLAQELIAIYHGKQGSIMKPETVQEMFQFQNSDIAIPYIKMGLGWQLFQNDSSFAVFHFGSDNLGYAVICLCPEQKMAGIFQVNSATGAALTEACNDLLTEACGLSSADISANYLVDIDPGKAVNQVDILSERFKKHVGVYLDTKYACEVLLREDSLILAADQREFLLNPLSEDLFVPSVIISPDSSQLIPSYRMFFTDTLDCHVLYQASAGGTYPIAMLSPPQPMSDIWKQRVGKYTIFGFELSGAERLTKGELLISGDNRLRLKLYYTSGEYLYHMKIESDSEITFRGIGGTQAGDTVSFADTEEGCVMTVLGLRMRKDQN